MTAATPEATLRLSATLAELVADAIVQDPELLQVARANVQRWLADGAQARQPLQAWEVLLADAQASAEGKARLQHALRSDQPEFVRLRDFAPLAGLLPREIRRQARDLCGYRP